MLASRYTRAAEPTPKVINGMDCARLDGNAKMYGSKCARQGIVQVFDCFDTESVHCVPRIPSRCSLWVAHISVPACMPNAQHKTESIIHPYKVCAEYFCSPPCRVAGIQRQILWPFYAGDGFCWSDASTMAVWFSFVDGWVHFVCVCVGILCFPSDWWPGEHLTQDWAEAYDMSAAGVCVCAWYWNRCRNAVRPLINHCWNNFTFSHRSAQLFHFSMGHTKNFALWKFAAQPIEELFTTHTRRATQWDGFAKNRRMASFGHDSTHGMPKWALDYFQLARTWMCNGLDRPRWKGAALKSHAFGMPSKLINFTCVFVQIRFATGFSPLSCYFTWLGWNEWHNADDAEKRTSFHNHNILK